MDSKAIMLESDEKGYNMVKKACTIMHSLIDDWCNVQGI